MQFEQPAALNRYVDPTIPLTWAVRWQSLKPILPMLLCCSALLVEQVAFRLWPNDRSLFSELPLLVVCSLLPIVLIIAAFEALTRVTHRSRRTIKLEPKRVSISPAKYNRFPWKQISAWRLEPIPETAGFSKLTLLYSLGKGTKRLRQAKLKRVVAKAFSSPEQFHRFLLVVGGGLTTLGAGMYFWGLSTSKRNKKEQIPAAQGVVESA